MSFVTRLFIKPFKATPVRPWNGSFVINGNEQIITCTLPSSFSSAHLQRVAAAVQSVFRTARQNEIDVNEFILHYSQLVVTARHSQKTTSVSLRAKSCVGQCDA